MGCLAHRSSPPHLAEDEEQRQRISPEAKAVFPRIEQHRESHAGRPRRFSRRDLIAAMLTVAPAGSMSRTMANEPARRIERG